MPVVVGTTVLASEYNAVAEIVNKVFGDKYSTVLVTDSDKTNHKFGWGAVNVDDNVPVGELITAERLQELVDRTNIMVDHTNINDTILVFSVPVNRTEVLKHTLVRAEDLNVVESKVETSILTNNIHLTIDPTNASSTNIDTSAQPYTRTTPWMDQLIGEHKWTFNDYNHARYFFNSGGQLRLSMEMSGGTTAGYYNWADIINEMGVLSLTWDNLVQSSSRTQGTSEGKGFYDLTDQYQLLFTSSGVTIPPDWDTAYGYGYSDAGLYVYDGAFWDNPSISQYGYGYGYSYASPYGSYANRYVRIYGKWADNGREVHIKIEMDDTAFQQTSDGIVEVTPSFLMPEIIEKDTNTTYIKGDARFDVNPEPLFEITNTFTSSDDS